MAHSDDKNPADFVIAPRVADGLEATQINKFHTRGGAGFAAEDANALRDRFSGASVDQLGTANALNGPDRVVDGVPIQTKYYANAHSTLNAAFDGRGNYRYGAQLLEVPSDQYDECVALMKEKIRQGKVPGLQDPGEAEAIVKRGDVSYRQAKNIAKAGNIDSLLFDMKNQCVTTGYAFAISFSINFAKQKWDGKSTVEATREAIALGLQSGMTSLITGIVTAQVLRTKAAAIGVVVARDGVRSVAQTQLGRKFVSSVASASLGKAVYGAAATNHVAKLLRTNAVTAAVTTVVISAPDFYRAAFHGSISWAQFSKNLVVNGAGVAGGAGGWMAGAAGGAALGTAVPGIGTAIGAFVGGVIGAFAAGTAASAASKFVLDGLVEDDAKEMVRLLADCLAPVASDYLLSESEVKELIQAVKLRVTGKFLRDMYACPDRQAFVYDQFSPVAELIIGKRPKISLPDPAEVQLVLDQVEGEAMAGAEVPAAACESA